jgi:ferric-dicitrate binding protein FerR (iron transport regulator)
MKQRANFWRCLALALCGLAPALLRADPEPGLLYAQTARPGTTITANATATAARPLARGETLTATGQVLNTPVGQPLLLVLSNGSTAYLPSGSQLTLEEFTQEPVDSTIKDRDYEPSRSTLRLNLAQGQLVFAGRQADPTSIITITTPFAQFRCHSQSLVVEVTGDSVTITLFEGYAEVLIPDIKYHDTVQGGQTATLTRKTLHDPIPLKPTLISDQQNTRLGNLLASARWAELRVGFVRKDGVLRPQIVVPKDFNLQTSVDDPRFR